MYFEFEIPMNDSFNIERTVGLRMKKTIVTFYLFLALIGVKSFASFELNEQVQQAYLQIIRLNFDEGKRLLDKEQHSNPLNQLPLLYMNYIDFLKAYVSEEKIDLETFSNNTRNRLKIMKYEKSPFFLYSRAELLIQESILNLKSGDYASAAWKIRKAYLTNENNSEIFPAFPLNKKISGMLNVFIGAIPDDYHWLADLAGFYGSIHQGTLELTLLLNETTGTDYHIYREELLYYLSSIQSSVSQRIDDPFQIDEMMRSYCSANKFMRVSFSNVLMRTGRNDEALQLLTDTSLMKDSYPTHLIIYKAGLARLRKLDYTSEKDFQHFISRFKGMNYIRSAYQKMAWIYLLQGNQKKYNDCMMMCKSVGSNRTEDDKEATEEAKSGEVPNPVLLRARLLFDGGYYREAMSEMANKSIHDFPRLKDQLEVTYRLARILQKLKLMEKAIHLFEETLKNGSTSRYYYAANSALLLGGIYEEKKDLEKAKSYYLKCLSMRNHGYQYSIDQKAKAGIARLNK